MTWTLNPSTRNPAFAHVVVNEAGDVVALVQSEADAKLIAAAPLLLAVVKQAYACEWDYGGPVEKYEYLAAIEAATGRVD